MVELVVFPLWDARAEKKKTIQSQSKNLRKWLKSIPIYGSGCQNIPDQGALASQRADFTLFAYLEKKAVLANVKGSIKQMNSMQGVKSASLEETLIDMKLEKLPSNNLRTFYTRSNYQRAGKD